MGLRHLFGTLPVMKTLDFFIVNQFWDYSLKDIAEATEVSHRTLQSLVPRLVREGVIVHTRTEGKAKLFKFNKASPLAQKLVSVSIEADVETGKGVQYQEKHEPLAVV